MTAGGSSNGLWHASGPGSASSPRPGIISGPARLPGQLRMRPARRDAARNDRRRSAGRHAPRTRTTGPSRPGRRAAPYTCPDRHLRARFPLVRGVHSNPLRSRERRFESCRGTAQRHKFEHSGNLGRAETRAPDLRRHDAFQTVCPIRAHSQALDGRTGLLSSRWDRDRWSACRSARTCPGSRSGPHR